MKLFSWYILFSTPGLLHLDWFMGDYFISFIHKPAYLMSISLLHYLTQVVK